MIATALDLMFTPTTVYVVAPLYPFPKPRWSTLFILMRIQLPITLTSSIFQLVLNHRSGTFAGMFPAIPSLKVLKVALRWASAAPLVVGKTTGSSGVSLAEILQVLTSGALMWQAVRLPVVPQHIGMDEDKE